MSRIERLKELSFKQKDFDGFLITNEANLLYFTGFPGSTCILIPKTGKPYLYVSKVNYLQAETQGEGFEVRLLKQRAKYTEEVATQVKELQMKKLAADRLFFQNYQKLTKALDDETEVKMQNKLVGQLRKVKDDNELRLMRKAAQLTSRGMKTAYQVIKPGIREYEAAAEIEYTMRRKGSWGTAFETIVASGNRSAFPHGGCTDREIRKGDLVVVDIGATYQYYRSDMTRTVTAGKPSPKQEKIYKIVKQAQEKAFQAIRSKAEAKEMDQIARKIVQDAGYGQYFVHGLGHGVGLEVHEQPTLNQRSEDMLEVGNVVTIEPGIYIGGLGGIRIEDTVVVRKEGAERLTQGPYTLETNNE